MVEFVGISLVKRDAKHLQILRRSAGWGETRKGTPDIGNCLFEKESLKKKKKISKKHDED